VNARTDLLGLVRIWEYWTGGNSVFRRALRASEHAGDTFQAPLDEASGHFITLIRSATPGDTGTYVPCSLAGHCYWHFAL
jgi:hypothetical protein